MSILVISAISFKEYDSAFENFNYNLENQTKIDLYNYKELGECVASIIYNINEEDRNNILNVCRCKELMNYFKVYQYTNKEFNLNKILRILNNDWINEKYECFYQEDSD